MVGGQQRAPRCEFWGAIDEVAFFARALSADEIAAMFPAGNPARLTEGDTVKATETISRQTLELEEAVSSAAGG